MLGRQAIQGYRRLAAVPTAPQLPRRWPVRPLKHQQFNPQAERTLHSTLRACGNGQSSSSSKIKDAQLPPTSLTKSAKRRQAKASQDLRSNPPATRGPVLQCIAYSTAEKYDLTELAYELRRQGIKWDLAPDGQKYSDLAMVISSWGRSGGNGRHKIDYAPEDDSLIDYKAATAETDAAIEAASTVSSNPFLSNQSVYATSPPLPYQEPLSPRAFDQGQNGEIWVFKSGSFVTWGLSAAEGRTFLREVIRNLSGGVEKARHDEIQTEEVDFVVDPTADTRIRGNLILLGRPPELQTFPPSKTYASLLTRYTLSLSLARSSALAAVEAKLDAHLESVSRVPHMLEVWGKQPLGRKEVIRKIGELMVLREAVNFRGGGLEDTPEIYWSEPQLEAYFDSVSTEFEMKERIDAINQKIDYASEVQSTLRALLTEASGHRMELIIIALIAVEVIIVLIREGPELAQKAGKFIWETLRIPTASGDDEADLQVGALGLGDIDQTVNQESQVGRVGIEGSRRLV